MIPPPFSETIFFKKNLPKPGGQCSRDLSKRGPHSSCFWVAATFCIPFSQPRGQDSSCRGANPSCTYQLSMFNYERPKHFIQSQNPCGSRLQPPGQEAPSFPSQTKQSSIIIQPRQCTEQRFSASSTVSSHITVSSSAYPASQQLGGPSSGQKVTAAYNQSPASFLSSILPSQPDYSNSKSLSAVDSK